MTQACCFQGENCNDLDPMQCLLNGGQPMGQGTFCASQQVLGGINCTHHACCWEQFRGQPRVCDDLPASACAELPVSRSYGRGTRCIWFDESSPAHGGCDGAPTTSCCLADGTRISNIPIDVCTQMEWAHVRTTPECPGPPVDEDCRLPEEDSQVGPTHTMELCAMAPMTPALVGAGFENRRKGYGVLLTARGVRNRWGEEPCSQAISDLFLDANNYGNPVFCSEQERFPGPQAHHGTCVLQPRDSTDPVTKPGYGVMVTSYQAPDWSECVLGSELIRCRGPVR